MTISVSKEWIKKRIRLNSGVLEDAVKMKLQSGGAETTAGWMERLFDDPQYMVDSLVEIDYEVLREKVEGPLDK